MLNLKELSISSVRLLTAVLDVCSNDTIVAEYDVVRNKDNMRTKRKTIRDDEFSGERDVPTKIQRRVTYFISHTVNYSQKPFFQYIYFFQI
jgi:hypothetical protein